MAFPKGHYFINLIPVVIDVVTFTPCQRLYWSLLWNVPSVEFKTKRGFVEVWMPDYIAGTRLRARLSKNGFLPSLKGCTINTSFKCFALDLKIWYKDKVWKRDGERSDLRYQLPVTVAQHQTFLKVITETLYSVNYKWQFSAS